jgi:DNA repair protein RecO (recombination protein O)
MPLVKTTAIVLSSRKWGEADRIVTCYASTLGKIRGVARGARRQKSRFGAALEPFTLCRLDLFEKTGDPLFRLSHVDVLTSHHELREDLELMGAAARLVNVVGAVTPERDADPQLFEMLAQGLSAVASSQDPLGTALLFQIKLLCRTGFRPQTDCCAACGRAPLAGAPHFLPTAGGLICSACATQHHARSLPLSRGSVAFLRQAVRLVPSMLVRLRAEGRIRNEIEEAVDKYVTVVAGKRLPPADFLSGSRLGR